MSQGSGSAPEWRPRREENPARRLDDQSGGRGVARQWREGEVEEGYPFTLTHPGTWGILTFHPCIKDW